MEYVLGAFGLMVCLLVGFCVGSWGTRSSFEQHLAGVSKGRAEDRHAFLSVLCRELANVLIWHDPDRYQRFYASLLKESLLLENLSKESMQRYYDEVAGRYPQYANFDTIGTRPYVLYADGLSWKTIEDIEGTYRDIVFFQTIQKATDPNWRHFIVISAEEEEHLAEYVQKIKDTKLRNHIERAVAEYDAYNRNDGTENYDSHAYTVRRLSHFAELRLGVCVKEENTYGIYGIFIFDDPNPDGSPRIMHSYYRSDRNFEIEMALDVLPTTI